MKKAGLAICVGATFFTIVAIVALPQAQARVGISSASRLVGIGPPSNPVGVSSSDRKTAAYLQAYKKEKKQSQKTVKTNPADTLNKQTYENLLKNPDLSALTPDTPFSDAIDIFRHSTEPPLKIIVLWRDLENAGIDKDIPVDMEAISGVSLGQNLELLLMSVSAGSTEKLGYFVKGGVITIATEDNLPKKMTARVYDVTDLVQQPSRAAYTFGGMGYGGYGGMMPYGGGGMGYQGYGQPYGMTSPYGGYSPYGSMGYQNYGTPYGSYGQPYGGYGRPGGVSIIPNVGAITTGSFLYVNPYISGSYVGSSYGYSRTQELANIINTLYGSRGRNRQ